MSYTILYRSMFAKVGEDKYIPMVEVGDNNLYEGFGKYERRVRNWQSWRVPGYEHKLVLSKKEIVEGIDELINATVRKHLNKPARQWDVVPSGPYWTYQDIYKNYGWLTAIAIAGKETTGTTARMVWNFFMRGFDQAVDIQAEFQFGMYPIRLCYYVDGNKRIEYYYTLNQMIADFEKRDGTECWVEYFGGIEKMWDDHRKRRIK